MNERQFVIIWYRMKLSIGWDSINNVVDTITPGLLIFKHTHTHTLLPFSVCIYIRLYYYLLKFPQCTDAIMHLALASKYICICNKLWCYTYTGYPVHFCIYVDLVISIDYLQLPRIRDSIFIRNQIFI